MLKRLAFAWFAIALLSIPAAAQTLASGELVVATSLPVPLSTPQSICCFSQHESSRYEPSGLRLSSADGLPEAFVTLSDGALGYASGRVVFRLPHAGEVPEILATLPAAAVALSPVRAGGLVAGASAGSGEENLFVVSRSGKVEAFSAAAHFTSGITALDVASDGCTVFYFSDGPGAWRQRILRFDICRGKQIADFPAGRERATSLRLLPDGGVLLAAESIVRLDRSGRVMHRYEVDDELYWSAMALSPDASSVFVLTHASRPQPRSAHFYRIQLSTGDVSGPWRGVYDFGDSLSVYGEWRAAVNGGRRRMVR